MITQYLNTLKTMVKIWIKRFDQQETIRSQLDIGFALLDTVELGESTFGKIVCIEFCEAYSTLTFGIFFASSALYQVLNIANSQDIQARKNARQYTMGLI